MNNEKETRVISDVETLIKAIYALDNGETFRIEITKIDDCKVILEKEKKDDDLEKRIFRFQSQLGIPSNIRGYNYIKTAIILAYNDPELVQNITKGLYPSVAKIYETTSSRVERAIRHALETTWKNGNMELINRVFGHSVSASKGKPTNSAFIAHSVNAMRMNLI